MTSKTIIRLSFGKYVTYNGYAVISAPIVHLSLMATHTQYHYGGICNIELENTQNPKSVLLLHNLCPNELTTAMCFV